MSDETRQTPVPERVEGTVFAYRGQELHGVAMTGTPDLVDTVGDGEDVLVHELPPEPDPIPVRIIQTGGRELRRFRVQHTYATDSASMIVGQDTSRQTVRIKNLSTDTGVWIGEAQHMANALNGYFLGANLAEITLNTDMAVFASVAPGSPSNPCPLAVMVEYTVHEQ